MCREIVARRSAYRTGTRWDPRKSHERRFIGSIPTLNVGPSRLPIRKSTNRVRRSEIGDLREPLACHHALRLIHKISADSTNNKRNHAVPSVWGDGHINSFAARTCKNVGRGFPVSGGRLYYSRFRLRSQYGGTLSWGCPCLLGSAYCCTGLEWTIAEPLMVLLVCGRCVEQTHDWLVTTI